MRRPARYPSAKSILRGQAVAFTFMLVMMWIAELLHMPHRLFGDSIENMWPRLIIRSGLLLSIWAIVHLTTSRLLRRLHELESYLRVCSWCRKVDANGEWLTLEDYFDSRFQTGTSHGICPCCAGEQLSRHAAAEKASALAASARPGRPRPTSDTAVATPDRPDEPRTP